MIRATNSREGGGVKSAHPDSYDHRDHVDERVFDAVSPIAKSEARKVVHRTNALIRDRKTDLYGIALRVAKCTDAS